jgi:hypothetical protein
MRAGDVPLYGAASAGQMGAAGLITRAGAATVQGELGSAKNPVYMMQVPLRLRTLHPKYLSRKDQRLGCSEEDFAKGSYIFSVP